MANGYGEMELELEGLGELEDEYEGELESEYEGEYEDELEAEYEAEAFGLGDVTRWASDQWNAVKTPGTWQRKALIEADKAALSAGPALIGTALGGPVGGALGGVAGAGLAGALVPDQEFEFEDEFESEFENEFEDESEMEGEYESFVNPVQRAYPDAMMEHLGRAAMEAESEFEAAEHFLPLIPLVASKLLPMAAKALPRLAGRVLPKVARVITRATPRMTRGVANIARTLHRDPRTRPLVRVIPSVARRAVTTIARHAAAGRPVTPRRAARILAHANHRVLGNPRLVRSVLRRSRRWDRRHRGLAGFPHPHGSLRHMRGVHPQGVGWRPRRRRRYLGAPGWGPTGLGGPAVRTPGWGAPGSAVAASGLRRIARRCPTCGQPAMRGVGRCCCCC